VIRARNLLGTVSPVKSGEQNMRNMNKEAAIWNLYVSSEFVEAGARPAAPFVAIPDRLELGFGDPQHAGAFIRWVDDAVQLCRSLDRVRPDPVTFGRKRPDKVVVQWWMLGISPHQFLHLF